MNVISTDEKTGIQALEREITPMKAKFSERQDHEYARHGTQCLIANFNVVTGQIVSPSMGDTRTEEDFVEHIHRTIETMPSASWVFVVDNLNTHVSEGLVKLVARDSQALGEKGKSGILRDMKTRQDYLKDKSHKIRFVYTPKHSSWLNQVEIWFSILTKRLLKRLSVQSTEELKEKISEFIDFFNKVMAKPFKWTYKGKVLVV